VTALAEAWAARTHRERVSLVVGTVLVLVILVYSLVWVPLQRERARLRVELPRLQADVAFMQSSLSQVRGLSGTNQSSAPNGRRLPLLSLIEQQAQSAGLADYIRQVSAGQKEGEASIRLGAVPFEAWIRWADGLEKQGVRLLSVTIARDPTPGLVDVRMTVSQEGAIDSAG
jgi:general secretion pathway protein M